MNTSTVYISIGNSDNKLTQSQWHTYIDDVRHSVNTYAKKVHGEWFSLPDSAYQNACWCVEIRRGTPVSELRNELIEHAFYYLQDSIAWAVAETEFLQPDADPKPSHREMFT
jgi:hypothetical protein